MQVFWQHYYNFGLTAVQPGSGIAALVKVHKQYAGAAAILYCNGDLYIMQRKGSGEHAGFIFALNNSAQWNGRRVVRQWADTRFVRINGGEKITKVHRHKMD